MEEEKFRRVMGHFSTGVTVVASVTTTGEPVGLTVNAFTSVSLVPPLVLVCVHREAEPHGHLLEAGHFGVSILNAEQADLAWTFSREDSARRFHGLPDIRGRLGSPLVPGALAWLECRIQEVYPGGDHSIVLGEVVDCEAKEGEPLLFFRGSLRSTRA